MDAFVVFQQMLILVLVMSVGFAIRRMNILDDAANAYLTKLLLRVALPATLVSSLFDSTLEVPPGEVFFLLGIILFLFAFTTLLSWGSPFLLRTERDERGVFIVMALLGNVGFMGIPLTYAFFGDDGMFYAVLYNIVFNFVTFSLGMKLIGGREAKLSIRFFFSPILLASLTSLFLFLLDIRPPYEVSRAIGLIGGLTTPTAMILLGSVLGAMPLGEMFRGWRIYAVTFVRLIAMPFAVYLVLLPFPLPPLFVKVMLVMAASPIAISTATLTIHYGVHQEVVSKGIFISTLLSVITMPLVLAFLF